MHLFYCPDISGTTHVLPEEESKHCIRVLRLKQGDTVHITDGRGNLHECRISEDHPKHCSLEVTTSTYSPSRGNERLHVAIAPTKNAERLEWFLEKATEIGIDEITPIICEHSERMVLKQARMEKVIISAMKQSLKSWLPKLNQPQEFMEFIRSEIAGQKFIAWCETGKEQHLQELLVPAKDRLILIGPEGDFSSRELAAAVSYGFTPVSLGNSRLRTETAGTVACALIESFAEQTSGK